MRRALTLAALAAIAVAVMVPAVDAASKRKPLKSCLAALDAAETVGPRSELYEENARRCRQGINSPEKVVAAASGPYTPEPSDFLLNVVVLEQSCFGSAGCNVQYQVEISYAGAQLPDEDQTFIVSYDLLGAESPKVGSFTVRGESVTSAARDFVSTPPDAVLTAVPKQVVKGS